MSVYYNEWDAYAAQWLRNLITAGHLPDGDVDERSITDVKADELKGYTQHHFFAGIGGWALAAQLAGVSRSERIVTGSPPCQPFSTAGRGGGYSDERHLAPHWLRLVAAIRPTWVFGEQVAAAIRKDDWLDDLLDALEGEGYATGASVLPACSVGAPHIRQRLWVVARLGDSQQPGLEGHAGNGDRGAGRSESNGSATEASGSGRVADTECGASERHRYEMGAAPRGRQEETREQRVWHDSRDGVSAFWVADTTNGNRRAGLKQDKTERSQGYDESARLVADGWMAEPNIPRSQSRRSATEATRYGRSPDSESGADRHESANQTQTRWNDSDWLWCRDGKWRPVESGTFPLANGIPGKVGRLRAYGNAIVPQVAAEVIREAMK